MWLKGVVTRALNSTRHLSCGTEMGSLLEKPTGDVVMGDESLMTRKAHGSCLQAPPAKLRWDCDLKTADRVCCYNRHFAEPSGYFLQREAFLEEVGRVPKGQPLVFCDTVTGRPLFRAPIGRSAEEFLRESRAHGWPSFRDEEVEWDSVRVLEGGECVSVTGTHLGHNIPDRHGNRFCINLVSVAGFPAP